MQEKGIIFFCVIVSLAGVAALFFLSWSLEPRKAAINELGLEDVGKKVLVSGFVASARKSGGNYFLKVCDSSACIQVPVFSSVAARMKERGFDAGSVGKGDFIEVVGAVSEYGGELEVVAAELDVLRK
ncbi:MAG: OB-fold nucleic acid binding domain-containing protein [Candidatus Micrarchaeia archaeon]